MKIAAMRKGEGHAKIEFYGCQLRCGYCPHSDQEGQRKEVMEVLEFIADPKVDEVYLGGAEPTIYQKELLEILQRLARMNKKVTLKTNGMSPEFLKETIGLVHHYVIEVKCPFDDPSCASDLTGIPKERAEKYLEALQQTLQELKGRDVSVWIRVIPGFINAESIERIGSQLSGLAKEVVLIQFLNNPENDKPFMGIKEPQPPEAEMVEMARRMVHHVPKVVVRGQTFSHEFGSSSAS